MKYVFLTLIPFLFLTNASAQKGFPTISGKTLEDQSISIPTDTKGKVTLIALAYSAKSDKYLKDWLEPIYRNFINPPSSTFMPSIPYDVNIYFIALLKGLAKTAKGKIESNLNKNMDPEYYEHTLISTNEFKPLKSALSLGKKHNPYFYVLNDKGEILYSTEGVYTKYKMQEIVDQVDKHSGRWDEN